LLAIDSASEQAELCVLGVATGGASAAQARTAHSDPNSNHMNSVLIASLLGGERRRPY